MILIPKNPKLLLDLQFLTDLYIVNTPRAIDKDRELKRISGYLKVKGINI